MVLSSCSNEVIETRGVEGLGCIDWLSPLTGAHLQTNHWDNRDGLVLIGSDLAKQVGS